MKDFLDLGNLYEQIRNVIASKKYKEIELPLAFKSRLSVIGDRTIVYHKYTAIAYKNNADSIIIPNYWFFLATDIYPFNVEIHRYYDQIVGMNLFTSERLSELKTKGLTEDETQKILSSFGSKQDAERICRFLTDYRWWHGGKELGRVQKDYYVSAVLSLSGLVNDSSTFLAAICEVIREKPQLSEMLVSFCNDAPSFNTSVLQQIFYGAPGTGKSHRIKEDENVKVANEKNLVFRTTFHPDSDYSTFVGCYKPTMRPVADKYKAVAGKDEEITYSFVPQAFLQSYVAAWNNPEENVYLVIEEINRGNCAQIFGDLFQLLDRDCEGFSEYPIIADKDLKKYLNGKDEEGKDVLTNKDGIKDGKLRLPKNLFIWATMNTSDQSLFPIDSAFKRRWDWVYMPIDTAKETWYIKIGESYYSWTKFLDKVNDELLTDETAEDKHLGFYFCKATEKKNGTESGPNVITAETFVGKVLFYLWNDVFKVYGIHSKIGNSKDWPYPKLYQTNGKVDEGKVAELMKKLEIAAEGSNEEKEEETEDQ